MSFLYSIHNCGVPRKTVFRMKMHQATAYFMVPTIGFLVGTVKEVLNWLFENIIFGKSC